MLYEVLRALLASVLPLLPIMFPTENLNLDEWTRTISAATNPEYLSPAPRGNTSINAQVFANDIDYSLTLDSIGYASRPVGDTPPVFDAIAAIAREIYPHISNAQVLVEFIPVFLAIAVWIRRPSTTTSLKRPLSPPGPGAINALAKDTNATDTLAQQSPQPDPGVFELSTPEKLSSVGLGSLTLETCAGSGLDPRAVQAQTSMSGKDHVL
ncbi:hypothetical protein C8Q78DRAFT_1040899 [Trametes maxima]|nr:hypothetical protein C8Q78DRAFT_1040899 [Trametes maxima]